MSLPHAGTARAAQSAGSPAAAENTHNDSRDPAFSARNGLAYGLPGLPLAFVALPLYVILPNHYARDAAALNALVIAYCVLPCLLKLAAAAALYFLVVKHPESVSP